MSFIWKKRPRAVRGTFTAQEAGARGSEPWTRTVELTVKLVAGTIKKLLGYE